MRALFPFAIPAWTTVNARAYLMIGSYATIASEADAVMSSLAPFGALDSPNDGETVNGTVSVSGWALDNRGVQSVVARIDETTEVALAYGRDRPDVCASWPGYPNCNAVGYAGEIYPSVFGPATGCPHLVEIVANTAVYLLIDGQPQWIWVDEGDVELL